MSQDPDLQPVLRGAILELQPLRESDFARLHAAASDPLIWALHPEPTRWQAEVFRRFFDSGLACGGALVVTDRASGAVVGSSRYYRWTPVTRDITIGYTFLARSHWGGAANREMKTLMLDHAFGFAERAWFEVGVHNARSRRAMEKLGAERVPEDPAAAAASAPTQVAYVIARAAWQAGGLREAVVAQGGR